MLGVEGFLYFFPLFEDTLGKYFYFSGPVHCFVMSDIYLEGTGVPFQVLLEFQLVLSLLLVESPIKAGIRKFWVNYFGKKFPEKVIPGLLMLELLWNSKSKETEIKWCLHLLSIIIGWISCSIKTNTKQGNPAVHLDLFCKLALIAMNWPVICQVCFNQKFRTERFSQVFDRLLAI